MQAMVLAAGLGTRLRPYTLFRPKPLFPVMDVPLLLRTVNHLRCSGFSSILVNAHHLHEQIVGCLAGYKDVGLQVEDEILGTGGAMRFARERLSDAPVLLVNGDICHDIDYAWVFRSHLASGADATLVLHDYPRFNSVYLDGEGCVRGFARTGIPAEASLRTLAFTGIQVVSPRLFEDLPRGGYADSISCYNDALSGGKAIRGLVAGNSFWTDIGTPQDYLDLHRRLFSDRDLALRLCGREFAGSSFTGEGVTMGPGVSLQDWVCIGSGAHIGAGAALSRVVVWDGAVVEDGQQICDTIVT
jgi:mannose-1-phosphate guanylyltransferase